VVDYLKIALPDGTLGTSGLALFTPTDHESGECQSWREAEHRNMKLRIHRNGYTELTGSLHKFWHGQHNGGPFHLDAIGEAVADLSDTFGFKAEVAVLRTLEFGLNVPMSTSAAELLRRAVLYKTSTLDLKQYGGKGCYRIAEAQQYYFKLYDKELHLLSMGFASPGPLLRVELKATRMALLAEAGITNLTDLTKPKPLAALGKLLERAFASVLFAAPSRPATLTRTERQFLTVGANFNYWHDLNEQHPESLRKNRTKYREIVAKHCPDLLANEASNGIITGWQRLLETPQSIPELTGFTATSSGLLLPGINTLNRVVEPVSEPRRCQTCSRDISGQSEQSKFCSEAMHGAAGKRCRNAGSNPRNNAKRSKWYPSAAQYQLFDVVLYSKAAT